MTTYVWMTAVLFVSGLLEMILGGFGVSLPLLLLAVFYLGVFRQWPFVLWLGIFLGSMLELCYGRSVLLCWVLYPLAIGFAHAWRWFGQTSGLFRQSFAGGLLGFANGLCLMLLRFREFGTVSGWLTDLFLTCIYGALSLPLMCCVLDWFAGRLALKRYSRLSSGRRDELVYYGDDEEGDEIFYD